MSVEKFREGLAKAIFIRAQSWTRRDNAQGERHWQEAREDHKDLYRFDADAILDLELLPGIPLRRVAELRDKLVVLDDDQKLPDISSLQSDQLTTYESRLMVQYQMQADRYVRVSPLSGEKEG